MAYTDAQIRAAVRQTYEAVNARFYDNKLPAWGTFEFEVTDSPRTLGCVHFSRLPFGDGALLVRKLSISNRLATLEALADTTYHEIAHIANAVMHGQRGHGYYWQMEAKRVGGCNPSRCCTVPDAVEHRPGDYLLGCPKCPKTYHYTKRTKNIQRALAGILQFKCPNGCGLVTATVRKVY